MSTIDKHGKLYLGRTYDLAKDDVTDSPLLYDTHHLTTHGIILGMTGSGKTGAGMILLEEVLLEGTPVLALDPKGDIANLLLTFPDFAPEDFAPWVDVETARRRKVSLEKYAGQEAHKWQEGLAKWDITGDHLAQLRQAATFTIFTPGSQTGQPIDVLHFLASPSLSWEEDEERLRERISGTVSALLGLVGIEADPLQSPEHILMARIFEHVWRAGEQLDLPRLIQLLQKPPFQQVGAFELDTFLSQKDRFSLARTLNNLIAAPGFEDWKKGTPLDVQHILYDEDDRPRASIFYLAHLNDAQKAFFITLFFEAVRDWLRGQSGTTNLRALLYFDEVFGYFPPYPANPPTKTPLMALIKQGRAAGLGVVLATQNPGDLDYKGLSNAGTWIVGSLRAERDKDRVMEGLEGAVAEAGTALDRQALDRALAALKPRVFLIHDIHAGDPVFFHTRWAMSYLCGPLTRKQVRKLVGETAEEPDVPPPAGAGSTEETTPPAKPTPKPVPAGLTTTPPALPPDLPQVFLPPAKAFEWALRNYEEQTDQSVLVSERHLVYTPRLLALGTVRMVDRKREVDRQEVVARLVKMDKSTVVDWDEGQAVVTAEDLLSEPLGEGLFAPGASALARPRNLKSLEKDFSDYLYYNTVTRLWYSPALDLYGAPGETRRDFRVRCQEEAKQRRDAEIEEARDRMDKKMAKLQARLRREERELKSDEAELEARKREELLSAGESVLKLVTGRRSSSMISRASRRRTMTTKAKADVEESLEAIEDLEEQLKVLGEEWEIQVGEIADRWADALEEIEEFEVKPRRADVTIEFCGLAWVPVWRVSLEDGQTVDLPAREEAGDED